MQLVIKCWSFPYYRYLQNRGTTKRHTVAGPEDAKRIQNQPIRTRKSGYVNMQRPGTMSLPFSFGMHIFFVENFSKLRTLYLSACACWMIY